MTSRLQAVSDLDLLETPRRVKPVDDEAIELLGVPSSPYTRKMVALLRFRRIPYRWRIGAYGTGAEEGRPKPKVQLLPTFYLPNADGVLEAVVDSTQIIKRLEESHSARSTRPSDPVLALIADLIEDFADEWLSKLMYHHRWADEENVRTIAEHLVYSMNPSLPAEVGDQMASYFTARQIDRLNRVGSNEVTGPMIEQSYVKALRILGAVLEGRGFLLGTRPSAADFGVYGQLLPLVQVDISSTKKAWQTSTRVRAWVDYCEDLSGLELDRTSWLQPDDASLRPLLEEMGQTYVPFILANEAAIQAKEPSFSTTVNGRPWTQDVMTYGVRCLAMLRSTHDDLPPEDKTRLGRVLEGTGCEGLFAPSDSWQ